MAAAAANGSWVAAKLAGLVMPTTRPSCRKVATVDSTAAPTPDNSAPGLLRTQAPIAPMVAELEMKPEASPSSGTPSLAPNSRETPWPAALMPSTNMTTSQMAWGLSA